MAATRVVFDCNIFLQALAVPAGPAGRCVELAIHGKVSLFLSPRILKELRDVTHRPQVINKLRLVRKPVENFFESIEIASTVLMNFPEDFAYQRDPADAHYINLALAAHASLIVSRDKDLLDLMDAIKPQAADFQKLYPILRIVDPVSFLRDLNSSTTPSQKPGR